MTHQYLSDVYCGQGIMLLGKKDSFCISLLDHKEKSSILLSERVFSCRGQGAGCQDPLWIGHPDGKGPGHCCTDLWGKNSALRCNTSS